MLFESQMGNETAPNAERGVHAASACAAALPFSLSSQKRRRGPGRGGRFSSLSPLSSSLPARSSRGEREKSLGVFYAENTIGRRPALRTAPPRCAAVLPPQRIRKFVLAITLTL